MGSSTSKANKDALSKAKSSWAKYNADYDLYKGQYGQDRQQANDALQQDFGTSGTDYFAKANQAGTQFANQQLANAAKGSAAASQLAARQSGMGKGQAALLSAGKANQLYDNNFMNAQQTGAANYQNAAQGYQTQMQNRMGNSIGLMGNAANSAQAATNTAAQVGANQMSDWDRNWGIVSGVGGMVSGVGSMVGSDERIKTAAEETVDYSPYLERIRKIMEGSPYGFNK
jgi:hypothetical protein